MIKTILKFFPFLFLSLSLFIIGGISFFIVNTFAQESPIPDDWVYPGTRLINKQVIYELCLKITGSQLGCDTYQSGFYFNIGIGSKFKSISIDDFNPVYIRGKTTEEVEQVFSLEEADSINVHYLTFEETDAQKIADWYLATLPKLGFTYHGGLKDFPPSPSSPDLKLLDFCKQTDEKCSGYKVGPLQITITPIIRVASYITIALPKDYLIKFADLSALPIWVLPLFVISMILFIILILGVIFYLWRRRKAKEAITPPVQPPLTPGIGPGSQQQNN